jgi:predicted GNAT family acetyltransferase
MNWYSRIIKLSQEFQREEEEDRTTYSLDNGSVIVTSTYPRYEFLEDLIPEEFESMGLDEDEEIAKIEHIEVDIASRGQGVGGQLLERAIGEARGMGVRFTYLNACPMGVNGLSLSDLTIFYEKYGFKVFKSQGNNNLMGLFI